MESNSINKTTKQQLNNSTKKDITDMKKEYIKPLVEFTEMENEDLLNYPLSKATTENNTGKATIDGPTTIIDKGDGGSTGEDGFVSSKEGYFEYDFSFETDF